MKFAFKTLHNWNTFYTSFKRKRKKLIFHAYNIILKYYYRIDVFLIIDNIIFLGRISKPIFI